MKTEAAVVFIAGLVLTLAGVGSVEDSVDNWELGVGVFVSVLGLALFWCGVKMINSTKER
jgi:hypothetical protein